jgi:hypothetical protein
MSKLLQHCYIWIGYGPGPAWSKQTRRADASLAREDQQHGSCGVAQQADSESFPGTVAYVSPAPGPLARGDQPQSIGPVTGPGRACGDGRSSPGPPRTPVGGSWQGPETAGPLPSPNRLGRPWNRPGRLALGDALPARCATSPVDSDGDGPAHLELES